MKKHKLEIAALTLLLGVLCYAFYESNMDTDGQKIALSDELFNLKEIGNKKEVKVEMLTLPAKEAKEEVQEEITKEETEKVEVEETVTNEVIAPTEETYVVEEPVYYGDASYNEDLGSQVVNYALQFVGNPYVYGGNSLTEGTDCSGFTKLVFANFGINVSRVAPSQIYDGVGVSLDNIKPGDIVLSGYDGVICHSALYIGDGKLVHALNSNTGIVVTDLYIMPVIAIRRVVF